MQAPWTRMLLLAVLALWPSLGVAPRPSIAQTLPLKPPLQGLVSMGRIEFHRQDGGVPDNSLSGLQRAPGVFAGVVVNLTWDQLEPRRGNLSAAPLERALDDVRAYNRSHAGRPLAVRLRVWPGPNAPRWAKSLDGPPVVLSHNGRRITVGRFWAAEYRDAWRDLHRRLAARFDADPLVREVSATSCSSVTDEMVLLPGDPDSVAAMQAAGFTDRQFRDCLEGAAEDYAGWGTTRVEFAVNPYRGLDSGRPRPDPAFTARLMTGWRQRLGPRAILGNHSLQEPLAPHLEPIYATMRQLGPPLAFQTHSPHGLDWEAAVRGGVARGAGSIELWVQTRMGGHAVTPVETLRGWAGMVGPR